MLKTYTEIPSNIDELLSITVEEEDKTTHLITAGSLWFIDTCSIMHIANCKSIKGFIDEIIASQGSIVITATILMELTSKDSKIKKEHMQVFNVMHAAGIPIIYLKEEEIFNVIFKCMDNVALVNQQFIYFIRELIHSNGAIDKVMRNSPCYQLHLEDLNNRGLVKKYCEFFRNEKTSKDSLGEEMLLLCMMLLTCLPKNIIKNQPIDMFLYSDDKRTLSKVSAIFNYLKRQGNQKPQNKKCMFYTTHRLAFDLYRSEKIVENELRDYLSCTISNNNLQGLCMTTYSLTNEDYDYSIDELVDQIVNNPNFKLVT